MIKREAAALLTGLLILAAGVMSEVFSSIQAAASGWVSHTREVIAKLESARAAIAMAESAERAFLLTSEERVLVDFDQARVAAQQHVQRVARLTVDNPRQQQQVTVLLTLVSDRFDVLTQAIALQRAGQHVPATELVRTRGLGQMEELATQFEVLRVEEERLLAERLARSSRAELLGTLSNAATTTLAVGLLAYLYRLWSRHAADTSRRTAALNQANERLHELATTLEQRVVDRTRELSQVNAELEQFAHTVAHDLRAPARNIQAYAELLGKESDPHGSHSSGVYLGRLAATATRMQELISGLLEYSRLAQAELRLEPVELRRVVEQVLSDLKPQIEASGGRVNVAPDLPAVLGHYATLGSALSNLVSNALKFVAPGQPPQVRIAAERRAGAVILYVEDQGIGLAPQDHERVFLPFTRLHGQESYPGTGVGLAIVRRSVERMGGSVHLHSAVGAGSRFELHLKAAG